MKENFPKKTRNKTLNNLKAVYKNFCPCFAVCLLGLNIAEKSEVSLILKMDYCSYIISQWSILLFFFHNHFLKQKNQKKREKSEQMLAIGLLLHLVGWFELNFCPTD